MTLINCRDIPWTTSTKYGCYDTEITKSAFLGLCVAQGAHYLNIAKWQWLFPKRGNPHNEEQCWSQGTALLLKKESPEEICSSL